MLSARTFCTFRREFSPLAARTGHGQRDRPWMLPAYSRDCAAPRLLNARALKTVTNPPGMRRGEEFSQDTCKIWRKFEECAAIGYHHLLRIASHSPIQARIRIGLALRLTKI